MNSLITTFSYAQHGSTENMEEILTKFDPLIHSVCKFEHELNYVDCKDELTIFVIKFVKGIDLSKFESDYQLIAYFKKSIEHEGARIFKKISKYLDMNS